ncbi:MAG TPA: serine/threonine-protein kinase [Kofleriaceae bacterium]|nr:serine/threonine-protein kinase [Kofleriaceae bacterium]
MKAGKVVGGVIGNYNVVRKLGEGGMGAVYLGQHTLLGRHAAIKVLLPALSTRPDIVNRFFNEARAATSINDPGIVQIFDFGIHTDGSAFIVMEFLEGETLDDRIRNLGRLHPRDALRIARQVAASLGAAHAQHIVHRDLKPENVFLVHDSEVAYGERAKVLDFGIAKLQADASNKVKTSAGAVMGTPLYMSPEQCNGAGDLDHRSDIYALGCVLFHALVGKPPFDGDGMGAIIVAHLTEPPPIASTRVDGIAPEVDAVLARCLAKLPAERFQTMAEVVTALGRIQGIATGPPTAPGATPVPVWSAQTTLRSIPPTPTTLGASAGQVAASPTGRRAGWIVAVAAAMVAAAGTAIVMSRSHGEPPAAAPTPAPAAAILAPAVPAPMIDAAVAATVPPPIDAAQMPDASVPPPDASAPPVVVHHRKPPPPPSPPSPAKPQPASTVDADGVPDHR